MLDLIRNILFAVLPWLAVITVVVVVHELGHFLVARAFGVAVDRFSLGFGKTLFSFRDKGGVEWRVGALPFGGYVKFSGDADASSSVPDADDLADLRQQIVARQGAEAVSRYFHFKPLWQRALVVLGGPTANFVLAVVVFAGILMTFGEPYISPVIDRVGPGTAAARAGFQPGDVITRMNGHPVDNFLYVHDYVAYHVERPITFFVERGGRTVVLSATPTATMQADEVFGRPMQVGVLGVGHANLKGAIPFRRLNLPHALVGGADRVYSTVAVTVRYVQRIFQGRESGNQLGGPIRIALTTKVIAQAGAANGTTFGEHSMGVAYGLISLVGFISVSIGFMNLLPVPMLDGGHLLFYAYEAVARRPLTAQIQAFSYRVGLALVVGLMLFATWNDLHLPVLKILGGHVS